MATPAYPIQNTAAWTEGGRVRICGGVKSGKTEALLQRTCFLVREGVDPESICVVVNTANAAEAFSQRLCEMLEEDQCDLSKLRITTIQLLAVEILGCKEARRALARTPRVLNTHERAFVLQDLTACGFSASSIKSSLTSLGRFWGTGIMPALPELPVGGDEDDAHAEAPAAVGAYLKEYLIMHQAMLPEELSYLCTLFIKHDLWRAVALGFDHVMVDDFQNISKTSQIVCEALAKKSFVVTGNTKAPVINREAFPYPEGLARFAEEHDQAITLTLEGANDGEAAGSPDDPSSTGIMLEVSAQQVLNIKWKTPEDEARGISQWIRKLTSGNKGARLSDFYLVVPNSHWAGAFERSLTSQFREHVTLLDGQLLSGDSHEPGHNLALSAFTRLNLLAQPSDPFAWRCWCGLGVADLGAKSWKHLLELAKTENLAVSEVLARLSKDTSCDKAGSSYFKELQRRYLEGMDFIERNQRKTGYALLKAVAGEDPDKAFSLLIEPFEGTEDAQTTFNQVGRGALDPSISRRHEAVRILSYGELTGLSPQTVVLVGLNDGLMPPVSCFASPIIELEREPFGKDYQALFRDTVGKASKTLVFSTTQKIEQKTAESLGIRAARLKTEHETTMAMLSPSCFLQEAGSLIPGSESGEYFLSRP